jgi:ABC-type multidrug transport system ATPase subunit
MHALSLRLLPRVGLGDMSLLELRNVSKRYGDGPGERIALQNVSLELDTGELVAVLGMRRSGRSTLLRVAAGIETPDTGVVSFAGRDLARCRGEKLGGEIGYCRRAFHPAEGEIVLEQLIVGQLTRGVPTVQARLHARSALKRVDAAQCAAFRPADLNGAEVVRVALARALVFRPKVLMIDEPTIGVDLIDRDEILLLLRSLANEGIAILISTGEGTCLSGADRALSLGDGVLRGSLVPELASVTQLHPLRRPA